MSGVGLSMSSGVPRGGSSGPIGGAFVGSSCWGSRGGLSGAVDVDGSRTESSEACA